MGSRLEYKKWTTIALLVVVLAGLVAAGPLSPGGNRAEAQTGMPEFGLEYGQTFYAQTGSNVTIMLDATDPAGDDVTITALMRPSGSTFTSTTGDPGTATLSWLNAGPAGGYSLRFMATDEDGLSSELPLLLVIEDSTPAPAISVDREEYLIGDEMRITVEDEHADVSFAELDEIQVHITSDSDAVGLDVDLEEDEETPRTFVGSVSISSTAAAGKLQASVGDTVNVEYESIDGIDVSATANVTNKALRLDRTIYDIDDSPEITVTDPGANISAAAVDIANVTVASSLDDLTLDLMETGTNTGIFVGNFAFSETMGGPDTLLVATIDDVKVTYDDKTVIVKKYLPMTVMFDKVQYLHTDLADLRVIDVRRNLDSNEIETISANLTSNSGSQGFMVPLRENGTNTGVFVSIAYVGFNRNGTSIPAENIIGVNVSGGSNTTITATYNTKSDQATVVEGISGADGGTGTTGAPPTEGIAVGTSQVINCDSFGGDGDHDGICTSWERGAPYLLRVYYPQIGGQYYNIEGTCDPCPVYNYKDVYVEIDYSQGVNGQFKPYYDGTRYVALENAKSEVASRFKLHYIVDQPIGSRASLPVWSQEDTTPGDGIDQRGYDQVKRDFFGTASERTNYGNNINSNYLSAKKQVYHYAVFADKMQHDPGASGLAEILGNDIIVSLGSFTDAKGLPGLGSSTIAMEEGTFLHELGHNLGLDHGGGFVNPHAATGFPAWTTSHEVNCKPNYPSVMNYVRQIPPTGVDLGDTTYYSKAALTSLDIDQLDEPMGAGATGISGWTPKIAYGVTDATGTHIFTGQIDDFDTIAINWNNSQPPAPIYTNDVPADIVNTGIPGCGTSNASDAHSHNGVLSGFNDMNNFILDFRIHNPTVFVNGMHEAESERPRELDVETWQLINSLGTSNTFTLLSWYEGARYEIGGSSETVEAASGAFDIGNGVLENITLSGEGPVELQLHSIPLKGSWNSYPTMVSIDGGEPTEMQVRSDTAGVVTVPLALSGNTEHNVKIMNAAIVPEFPVAAIVFAAVMASIVGLMVWRGRTGSFFGRP